MPDINNTAEKKESKAIKMYKGFNKDMTCRGFQFKEGKTYEVKGDVKLCKNGFHACKDPIDCFGYYEPGKSVYHEVFMEDVSDETSDDSKRVAKKITIGAEISLQMIGKLHAEYVKERVVESVENGDSEQVAVGDKQSATAGECGSATAGYRGFATAGECGSATAGDGGSATAGDGGSATAGDGGSATAGNDGFATAGECGSATAGNDGSATAGNCGSATAGDGGSATAGDDGFATAGDGGSATAGNRGVSASRGIASVGEHGVAVAKSNNSPKVKGQMGALLVCAEEVWSDEADAWVIGSYAVGVVDGEKLKEDTWYTVRDGEFVEIEE